MSCLSESCNFFWGIALPIKLVSQATPFAGRGHDATTELSLRNAIIDHCGYTAKSYVLNENWNQSDPDLYPEMQLNFLAMGLIPNRKLDLYQFDKNSPKTCCSYRSDTDVCVLI